MKSKMKTGRVVAGLTDDLSVNGYLSAALFFNEIATSKERGFHVFLFLLVSLFTVLFYFIYRA